MLKKRKEKTSSIISNDSIISIICVTHNDADIIEDRLQEIHLILKKIKTNFEIVIVDNFSSDNTIERVRKLHTRIPYTRGLLLSKEYDMEVALTAGLENCIGDYVILFNLYTDPPNVIPAVLNKLAGGMDIVIGKMEPEIVNYDSVTKLFLKFIEYFSKNDFHYSQSYFYGVTRRAVNAMTRSKRKSRNFVYIQSLIGFKKIVLKYKPLKKFSYKINKETFFAVVIKVIDIVISNSFKPIRILSLLGMFLSFLYILYVFGVFLLDTFWKTAFAPKGWVSESVVLSTLFFLLFSILTLIAEYLIRIVKETRNDPLYYISDEFDKSVITPQKKYLNIV